MSKIGKKPIDIPKGVEVKNVDNVVTIKGPKGALSQKVEAGIKIEIKDGKILLSNTVPTRNMNAKFGLYRSILANNVIGVADGFTKVLELTGVGYRAAKEGKKLVISIGFSHPVEVVPPDGINFELDGQTKIKVMGCDRVLVGQTAANIKFIRAVEPYKAKGIKYEGQYVRRKAGKAAKAAAA